MQTSKPNILFLMADQHRADCVGVDGNAVIRTPNLDRIASEGIRFRHAYSSTPTCTPARAALLTGLSPWHHGLLGTGPVGRKYAFTLPQALRDSGYYTQVIGKCHYAPQRNLHGFHHGILDESGRVGSVDFRSDYRAWFYSQAPNLDPDATGVGFNDYKGKAYVLPERLHPTAWTADVAVNFLKTYQRPEPFFLKVSFARPHSPYDPPERWMRRYGETNLPAAKVGEWVPEEYARRSWERDDIWHGDMGPAETRTARQAYYGSVSFIDEHIGRILEALEQRGQLENTLILYTSDHGDMTGDHHLWRKSYPYEASARIPMLMRWPKGLVSAGRGMVSEKPVEIRDIAATCLDAAGATTAHKLDGLSMLNAARGRGEWRQFIDLEHDVCYDITNHWNALTDGRTKYIFHARSGQEQLFDVGGDPRELADLAGDRRQEAALRLWRNRMIAHFEERGEAFVKNGRLALRPERLGFSPLYPRNTA